jgi:exosortase B
VWSTDEQGHGPIILAVSVWLFYSHRHALANLQNEPMLGLGIAVLLVGLAAYVLGRSQSFLLLEVGSQLPVMAALILLFMGKRALRLVWFPLFFLIFMTPFPEALVAAATGPLKSAVSVVAADLLYALGYPVSRVGVILNVGQYQLLVADACAGLNSMFTLEALGLLYMNMMKYTSVTRNVVLSILVIPIAFVANVVRVMILVLVTYHFGDAAGQGFVHSFAGMVLFLVGLVLVLATDYLLGFVFKEKPAGRVAGV